jgi:hypothetical protein
MGTLELEHVSPALNEAPEMSLSMPGHYGRSEVRDLISCQKRPTACC